MKVQIVMSGLCEFLNVRDLNEEMPEPSVILVQTDNHLAAHAAHDAHQDHEHIAYLAFDTRDVTVDKPEEFEPVPKAEMFRFYPFPPDGVEISIPTDPPSRPYVNKSYARVAHMDHYWPEARDAQFDRDQVPVRGDRPKKGAVRAFMRFGEGQIAAGRVSKANWKFKKNPEDEEPTHSGNFAEEVLYEDFPHGNPLVVELKSLDKKADVVQRFQFTPFSRRNRVLLFLGNHLRDDMADGVQRRRYRPRPAGIHFEFLNRIVKLPGPGPVPTLAAEDNDGACGVGGGNGNGTTGGG